ncbi:MAG: O-antigen ligase family protein [Acidobacteriia bacterium]|nr:O-antigen ligase family protein [Terriglobia bacterium]
MAVPSQTRWPRRVAQTSVCGRSFFAALLIGLGTPLQFEWIGILYASEVLLALVAVWALLAHLADGHFWQPPFTTLLTFLGVTMLAYFAADLVLGTEPQNLERGWARNIVLGSNFIGLYFLSRRNPFNLILYAISAAASVLVYLAAAGRLLDDWKFGASAPVTLLVACLLPLVAPAGALIGSLALATLGLLHIALNSREIGGNCLLAGVLLFARCSVALRLRSLAWVVLGVLVSSGLGMLFYAYILTDEAYGQRRQFSNAWRTAALITAADAIAESPWMGNGSQANNSDLQSRYDSIFAERTGIRYRGQPTDSSTFSPHSQILQACFEAGILGAAFFFYLGWKLVRGFGWCVFRRNLDVFSVLFAFCLLRAIWHLLFSPFAGLARLDVALAAAIVCVLDTERRHVLAR